MVIIQDTLRKRKVTNNDYPRIKFKKTFEINRLDSDDFFLATLVSVIEKNLLNPDFKIQTICKNMGLSKSNLFRKIKSATGKSPNQFIHSYKMNKAITLIKKGETNISDIAFQAGFSYPSYFTLQFRKMFGKSPSEFIKSQAWLEARKL